MAKASNEDYEIIEVEPDPLAQAKRLTYECKKIIAAGIWLMRNGYGRMQMLPYMSPTCCWRIEFHVEGNTHLQWFRYSSANGSHYLANHCGWKLRRNIAPKELANAILQLVPEDLQRLCEGSISSESERWLQQLESTLKLGLFPIAFDEFSTDFSSWDTVGLLKQATYKMNPQPGYTFPGRERKLVETEPIWREGLATWQQCTQGRGPLELDRAMLDDEELFKLSRLLGATQRYTSSQLDMIPVMKALVGALLRKQ